MLTAFNKFLTNPVVVLLRGMSMVVISFWLILVVSAGIFARAQSMEERRYRNDQTDSRNRQSDYDAELRNETEHRMTAVETNISSIQRDIEATKKDVSDIRTYGWGVILGMAGLLGERGMTLLKGKKSE